MEYTTMPAGRAAESVSNPVYESPSDAAKNNADIEAQPQAPVESVDKMATSALSAHVLKRRGMKGGKRKPAAQRVSRPANGSIPAMPSRLPESTIQPKHEAKHRVSDALVVPSVAGEASPIDAEESQYDTDNQRGFTVTDKRQRSRDELLNMPLDKLIASIDQARLTKNQSIDPPRTSGKHVAGAVSAQEAAPFAEEELAVTNEESLVLPSTANQVSNAAPTDEYEIREITQRYKIPPQPDHGPVIQNYTIPSKPDHEPTVHLGEADSDADNEDNRSPISKLMTKARTIPQFFAAHLTAFNTIERNKNETATDKEKRNKKIARIVGVTAIVVAVAALSRDNPDFQHTVGGILNNSGEGSLPQGALDPIQERIIQQHTDVLTSLANVIPVAGGGEAFTIANGADPSIWYQHQAEFLQLFPNEAYLMPDGNVGFNRPGELSDQAKEYWARKFGLWH